MSDLRARLADALHVNGCHPDDATELADALLSLPGIAIVELPEPNHQGHWPFEWPLELDGANEVVDVHEGLVWIPSLDDRTRNPVLPSEARDLAAVLLAAADVAEEVQ